MPVIKHVLEKNFVRVIEAILHNLISRAPTRERRLLINKPFLADFTKSLGIKAGDASGDFRSRNFSSKHQVLWSILLHLIRGRLNGKQLIIHFVLRPGDLQVSEVLTHDFANVGTDIRHVLGEPRTTKEIMTKDSTITVWTENRVVSIEFRNGAHELVRQVTLNWQVHEAFLVQV